MSTESLLKRIEGMKSYLLLKFEEKDWHGVMDAAADLRELETELRVINEIGSQEGRKSRTESISYAHGSFYREGDRIYLSRVDVPLPAGINIKPDTKHIEPDGQSVSYEVKGWSVYDR